MARPRSPAHRGIKHDGNGNPRYIVGRVLNHAESGVTAVYDRHSYDAEKKDALDKWAAILMRLVSDLKAVGKSAARLPVG